MKWFNGRWGLRGDYRFITVKSKDDAPTSSGKRRDTATVSTAALLFNAPLTHDIEDEGHMVKRMIAMLAATMLIVAGLGLREVQADSSRDRAGGGVPAAS